VIKNKKICVNIPVCNLLGGNILFTIVDTCVNVLKNK